MIKKYVLLIAFVFIALKGVCTAESNDNLLTKAETLREEGKTLAALNLYNEAIINFQQKHDYSGVLKALGGRLISWQHLYNHGEEKVYAILARKDAESMLVISQEYNLHDSDPLIHFLFGKSCIFLKDFACAEMEFQKAVQLYAKDNSEKGDWLAHLGEAIYKNGKPEEGEKIILAGIQQIQAHQKEEDSFKINVWTSGAYLRLAKILVLDNKVDQAKKYFSKGEEIVLNDPRLVIRKQQLEIILKKIVE